MEYIKDLIILFAIVAAFYLMLKERKRVPAGQVIQDPISSSLKPWIWVVCFLNPIWGGAILYYGWKGRMPVMAKQANKISLLVFLLQIVLVFALMFLVISGK